MQLLASRYVNWWTGVDYCVFISCLDSHSDGTHSLHPLVSKWCNNKFSKSKETISVSDGLGVIKCSANVNYYWWTIFKARIVSYSYSACLFAHLPLILWCSLFCSSHSGLLKGKEMFTSRVFAFVPTSLAQCAFSEMLMIIALLKAAVPTGLTPREEPLQQFHREKLLHSLFSLSVIARLI